MHRWKRGPGSPCPCPWGTPASGQPLCMCWGTSCRALGYLPPPSSSTSRYCPSPASQNPQPPSPDCSSQLPRTPAWPSPLSSVLRASQDLFVRDAPRHSERSLVPGLRGLFPHSPSTKRPTPSAPSSSPSAHLAPQLPPSEMFFASSWKVNQMPPLPALGPSLTSLKLWAASLLRKECGKEAWVMGSIAGRRIQMQGGLWGSTG